MPGLFGFYWKSRMNKEENIHLAKKMAKEMINFDNICSDMYVDDQVCIGQTGLNTTYMQIEGTWSPDKRYCCFLEGQIFSDKINATKKNILDLFIEYKENCINHLKGNFIIIIYDTVRHTLSLMNDRFGYKYLFYYEDDKVFVFSSEMRSLLKTNLFPLKINEAAIYDMFTFQFILGNETFFENIKLVPHASIFILNGSKSKELNYWEYPNSVEYKNDNIEELAEEGAYLINQSIMRNVKEEQNIGVMISGGLDSRSISAFLNKNQVPFTLLHYGSDKWIETKITMKVAETLNRKPILLDESEIDYLEVFKEYFSISNGLFSPNQIYYSDLIKKGRDLANIDFVFHGTAYDVLLGSCFMLLNGDEFYKDKDIYSLIKESYGSFTTPDIVEMIFSKNTADKLNNVQYERVKEELKAFPKSNYSLLGTYFYLNNRGRRYTIGIPNAASIYANYGFPGLDYDLFDFAVRVPIKLRKQKDLYREILIRNFPGLSKIPYSLTSLPLHKWETPYTKIIKRCKKYLYYINRATLGKIDLFEPLLGRNKKFRKDKKFRNNIITYLSDSKTFSRNYYDEAGLKKLIELQDSGRNYFPLFESMLAVEMFYRKFID